MKVAVLKIKIPSSCHTTTVLVRYWIDFVITMLRLGDLAALVNQHQEERYRTLF